MIRRPPRSTRTDTRFPYTTLFRSSQSLIKAQNAKDLARKLRIDSGAFSCKQSGTKPWNVDEVQRTMELGQNLIPITWLAHRYGHGLVMLETEAERRERAMRDGLAERAAKIAYLERSEDRRVGKESVRTGRSWWWPVN